MRGDYAENLNLLFKRFIETIKNEKQLGRHPSIHVAFSKATSRYIVWASSEQISTDKFELRDFEYKILKDLLEKSGIECPMPK
jgi:hypothetical protein